MTTRSKIVSQPDVESLLTDHWLEISRRAAAKAARRIVWERRLVTANCGLAAAVVFMVCHTAATLVWLNRLQHSLASATETVRSILS